VHIPGASHQWLARSTARVQAGSQIKYGGGGFWVSVSYVGALWQTPDILHDRKTIIYVLMNVKLRTATIDLRVFPFSRMTWRIQASQEAKKLGRKNRCRWGERG
jgi:hypothetical protein